MKKETRLYVACIIALVTMAFGFVVRAFLITDWGVRFNCEIVGHGPLRFTTSTIRSYWSSL